MSLLQPDVDDTLDPASVITQPAASEPRRPSYHPTRWAIVNRTLDIVDNVSGGRAKWVQSFFSFAFFGGLAAIVNMIVFYIVYYRIALPVIPPIHNVIAWAVATEISLFANFIPNDYFTFSHLASHGDRSWGVRCLRYHITSISGSVLTLLLEEVVFTTLFGITPIISNGIAIMIVLFYNFTVHNVFTYRHKKLAQNPIKTV